MADPGMCEVKTADLIGSELDWAIEVHLGIDKPKTFACHHYGPTCRACHDMVMRWRDSNRPKLGDITSVPKKVTIMTKKYYKASKELPNGEVLELRLCQSTWLATRYAPEEWTESLLVFIEDEQVDLDACLTTDEEEAIQELLDGGRWAEYFPDD